MPPTEGAIESVAARPPPDYAQRFAHNLRGLRSQLIATPGRARLMRLLDGSSAQLHRAARRLRMRCLRRKKPHLEVGNLLARRQELRATRGGRQADLLVARDGASIALAHVQRDGLRRMPCPALIDCQPDGLGAEAPAEQRGVAQKHAEGRFVGLLTRLNPDRADISVCVDDDEPEETVLRIVMPSLSVSRPQT